MRFLKCEEIFGYLDHGPNKSVTDYTLFRCFEQLISLGAYTFTLGRFKVTFKDPKLFFDGVKK